MKHPLLSLVIILMVVSCSAKKQIETSISQGNYTNAISTALRKLENNKYKKRKKEVVLMLKEAYDKIMAEDLAQIDKRKKDGNPELYKPIFETYLALDAIQNDIKRVLPLKVNGKAVSFNFVDFSDNILNYRYKTSAYLLNQITTQLSNTNSKAHAREAYDMLSYIEKINPNYKNTRQLLDEAHKKGVDHIFVSVLNATNQIIPKALEQDLLNLNTFGLDTFWTHFHSQENTNMSYDYAIDLKLLQLDVSPEQINERQHIREREIIDGWDYLLDDNGNVVKDSLGNDIKIDRIITTRASVFEVFKTKSTQVIANVLYTDLNTNTVIDMMPLESGFIFENSFGYYEGDKRALLQDDLSLISEVEIPFPTDTAMIIETGANIKLQFKTLISKLLRQ